VEDIFHLEITKFKLEIIMAKKKNTKKNSKKADNFSDILRRDIKIVNIADLKPHPVNIETYGEKQDVTDLVANLKKNKLREPIAITQNYVILSGHRRVDAFIKLKKKKIPAFMHDLKSDQDQIDYILSSNVYKTKSMLIRLREAMKWEKNHKGEFLNKGGKSRDKVAQMFCYHDRGTKVSGKTYSNGKNVVKNIDAWKESEADYSKLLTNILNNYSIDSAYRSITVLEILLEKGELEIEGVEDLTDYVESSLSLGNILEAENLIKGDTKEEDQSESCEDDHDCEDLDGNENKDLEDLNDLVEKNSKSKPPKMKLPDLKAMNLAEMKKYIKSNPEMDVETKGLKKTNGFDEEVLRRAIKLASRKKESINAAPVKIDAYQGNWFEIDYSDQVKMKINQEDGEINIQTDYDDFDDLKPIAEIIAGLKKDQLAELLFIVRKDQ
jgi:ParB-like nuclease family protein